MNFKVYILGCGSALPSCAHLPSSQVVEVHSKLYMIDCGEGAQREFRRHRLNFNRLRAIFISHLHGDHCFGLPGLLSSLGLLGRTGQLDVWGPRGLRAFLEPILQQFCHGMSYEVVLHEVDDRRHALIFEDRSVRVSTLPLEHRTPTTGYLIEEQPAEPHINKALADAYDIPLSAYPSLKRGEDFVAPSGRRIANELLVSPARAARRYAYCSDTAYSERIIPWIEGIDLLYHEATFSSEYASRALATGHSTAEQAARIALKARVGRLVIGHYSARHPDPEPLLQEAQRLFPKTIAAEEGLCLEIEAQKR
ncbi:ribonuclease Z [Porphyromonas sp. COT-239 OH1446]|uniref:ribonuclease Z n=1 Tax=Porphyromonas sp. COT-239 OH1446 TaxID=1515613 RepID=UPI00052D9448|nr:ribonuclease Z [Porphyromonas sp. COT-239 OH1446]KGN67157.1 ribonuclease Z [Porphyromonas sp. COT-239 OH1446]